MKKVLLLCTTHNDLGLIYALKKLEYFIVATGNKENTPGEKEVDKWIKADYSDLEVMLEIAKNEKIDRVCACCNDFGVYTAAYIAEKLGLPGYDSYETTLILHNKDKFKKFAEANNIITPVAQSFISRTKAIKATYTMQLPVIVKPVDSSAGNGISVISNSDEIEEAIKYAFSKSRAERIVIEPFVKGSQHGFCTFLVNQKVVAYCTNNEYSILNPYRVEIDTFPATNWDKCYQILIEQIEKIANILKLKDGIFHLQYIYNEEHVWILEVMRRTIGNMYHILGNPLNGIEWEYWETKARCGLDCTDFPKLVTQKGFFAYKTILAEKNGRIIDIFIPDELEKYTFKKFMLSQNGDIISDYKNQPIGFLFMKFESSEEMKRILINEYRNDLVIMEG